MSDLPRLRPGSAFLLLQIFGVLMGGAVMGGAVMGGAEEDPCKCFILEKEYDWSLLMSDHCCVKLSLSVDSLEWNIFTSLPGLRILDLSGSGILEITDAVGGANRTNLEFLYLNNNHLKDLPDGFLRNAPNLKVLHVENNELRRLPENFLKISDQISEIHLNSNHLISLPADLLKPSLTKLNFLNNSLDCTCVLYDQLGAKLRDNHTSSLLDGVICATPNEVRGLQIVEVERGRLCRSHGLTVALICVPLGALLLFLCWYCCCRKHKGNYTGAGRECRLVTVDRNGAGNMGGEYHHYEPQHKNRTEAEPGQFKDPILLRPSAALLGSSRDLYEEVEIKLGTSADSLVKGEGQVCQEGPGLTLAVEEEEEEELKAEIEGDAVSVTDVMKDSTDREKLYLNQSTDYYSLVPGIELEDSDHGDYESVDLT
ncbi:uncharacterized protein LOC120922642 [Rana temporaria]|uniref:uncharacterized protein LOC120922642 n=1 Tax=Rana temporaria TaxID=8407 RepID=UPI001AAD8EB6|nr:uncharacterized protein LOC120922642 [Rana temporaria]